MFVKEPEQPFILFIQEVCMIYEVADSENAEILTLAELIVAQFIFIFSEPCFIVRVARPNRMGGLL